MKRRGEPTFVSLPNVALLSVLLTLQSVWFVLYSLLGQRDPFKRQVCVLCAAATSIFLITIGRRTLKGKWPLPRGCSLALTGWQVVWVTCFVVLGGLFHWWFLTD
jgi:hypothetical protein